MSIILYRLTFYGCILPLKLCIDTCSSQATIIYRFRFTNLWRYRLILIRSLYDLTFLTAELRSAAALRGKILVFVWKGYC